MTLSRTHYGQIFLILSQNSPIVCISKIVRYFGNLFLVSNDLICKRKVNSFKYLNQDLTDLEGENVTIIFGRNLENPTILRTAAAQNCDDGVSLKDTQWKIFRIGCKISIWTALESRKICLCLHGFTIFHKSTIY